MKRTFTHILAIGLLALTLGIGGHGAAPGALDTTFDPGEILWQGFAFPAFKHAIVLQPDGKVVIGGQFDTVGGVSRILIARLNPNGTLDTSFNTPLQTILISGSQEGEVYDILQQPDGKFIVSGYFNVAGQWKTVVRLNNDGSLDGSFNVTTTGLNPEFNNIYRMLLQPDGKIVIGSNSLTAVNGTPTGSIARLTANGALDTPLGITGNVFFSIFSLALQSDGRIIAAGGDGSGKTIARLNMDGTRDKNFTPPSLGVGSIRSLAIESDGQILAGSNSRFSIDGGPLTDGLIRLNSDGSHDPSFNPPDIRTAWTLHVQNDGKIAVGGSFTVNFGLFLSTFGRLNPDGSLDFMCTSGPDNDLLDMVRQPDGKYVVAGTFEFFDEGATRIVRRGVARILDSQSAPPTGKIVFDSRPTPSYLEIASINPDGSGRTPLTTTGADYDPSVSADGSKIAFVSLRDQTSEEIYIMNADGSGQTRLTTNDEVDLAPSISADGTKIAFASLRDGNWEIYTMNSDGSNLLRVTTNTFRDEEPAFSPDGGKIVFRSNRDGGPNIYVMDANGANTVRLTNDIDPDNREPVFSPDGTRIAFRTSRDGNFEIYSMNATDGSNLIRLTNNSAIDSNPTYSPDGSRIAFVSTRDGVEEIYVMEATGLNPSPLTNNVFEDNRPSWGGVGQPPQPPAVRMKVEGGNVLVGSPGQGLILRSSGGTCVKIGIDNAGALTTAIVACP
jgi:uncharacterized delta-60 repeat protein